MTCRNPIDQVSPLPRFRVRWFLLLAVPLVAAIVAALQLTQQPVLWNVTEPGMTVEEVRRALPKAVPPAEPKRLANGLELKLVAAGVDNLERAFDAELYFGADGLQMVRLLPTRRPRGCRRGFGVRGPAPRGHAPLRQGTGGRGRARRGRRRAGALGRRTRRHHAAARAQRRHGADHDDVRDRRGGRSRHLIRRAAALARRSTNLSPAVRLCRLFSGSLATYTAPNA